MFLKFLTFLFLSGSITNCIHAQYSPGNYRINLTDKNNTGYSIDYPEEFLSERALQRRISQNIPVVYNDLPVSMGYIDSLSNLGIPVINCSKWFNSVLTAPLDSQKVKLLQGLSFVKDFKLVKPFYNNKKSPFSSGIQSVKSSPEFEYGLSWPQVELNKGQVLHTAGYTGKGVYIAVIDAGFLAVDTLDAFKSLRDEGRILFTRDFVNGGTDVFRYHNHGTNVLSTIAGYLPATYKGTAPDASFALLRSEDTHSEYLIEEDNWTSAAEFADSAGFDLISSSLGYSVFDDPSEGHVYADMNGNTTRISKAADIAASKGMLVVVSAGNLGTRSWKYISAPADADSVLAAGAVDPFGGIAGFSSRGPSSDGRIKPDICAVGKGTYSVCPDGKILPGDGTSYSAPIIAGLAACLWQANPEAANMQIYHAILQSADRYQYPDTIYGYGIPDFQKANLILRFNKNKISKPITYLQVSPNPFSDNIYMAFESANQEESVLSVFNFLGQPVKQLKENVHDGLNLISENRLSDMQNGIYYLYLQTGNQLFIQKIVKL